MNLKDRQLEVGLDKASLLEQLADRTSGQSGAFCAAIIQEAALLSARRAADAADILEKEGVSDSEARLQLQFSIKMDDFDEAIDKVWFGTINESSESARTEYDKRKTAIHEVGHALVATLLRDYQYKVGKVTIITRGNHLGYMMPIPKNGKIISSTREQLESEMMVCLGGRVSCELLLNAVDTGPRSDFEKTWSIARRYVVQYGMSELGIISPDENANEISTELADEIDRETRALVKRMKAQTDELLSQHLELIELLAEKLLLQNTILAPEWYELIALHAPECQVAT